MERKRESENSGFLPKQGNPLNETVCYEIGGTIYEIEAGNVSTVIVRDMSRLGRDYLKVGYYTEYLQKR